MTATDAQAKTARTAIVTASDSGIGKATAVALARAGFDVGITWHADEQGAQGTAEEVRALGRRAEVRRLDLEQLPEAADVVDELADALGGQLWALVSNAGGGNGGPFLELSYDEWRSRMRVNLDGAFLCLQRAARRMVAAGQGGRLVAITSVHETAPRVGATDYVTAKHGLGGLVKNAALELSKHGITVNAVAPGEIATPLTGNEDADPETVRRPGVPLGRAGGAYEIAHTVAFLCSDEASYTTGASYVVDGGMLLMGPHGGSDLPSGDWREG
jgi:NAD(P)-dependent dehydrogenase (short-subunit alcohol dehydrogenase family)